MGSRIYKAERKLGTWVLPANIGDCINVEDGNAMLPQSSLADSGDAMIVWHQTMFSQQIFMSEKRNGIWANPQDSNDYISLGFTSAENESSAIDDSGNSIIAWRQSDGTVNGRVGVYFAGYRNGLWTITDDLSKAVSLPETNVEEGPFVAISDNGDAVIVWTQSDGNNTQVYMSHYR